GVGLGNLNTLETLEVKDRRDFREGLSPVTMNAKGSVSQLHFAAVNLAEGYPSEVIRISQVGDQELEPFPGMSARWGDVFDDGIEQRFHRAADMLEIRFRIAVFGARINHGKIHLFIRRVERTKKVPDLVQHLVRIGIF